MANFSPLALRARKESVTVLQHLSVDLFESWGAEWKVSVEFIRPFLFGNHFV
jgi:hypothetical protein